MRTISASDRITSDVCVVGGGPSGSTVAHRLASLGHDVCLIERHAFPRPHVAASLPPSILPLLECIGVRDRVESAGFLRPEQTIVWWSEAFPTVTAQPGPPGFHVDRAVFDRLLLQNAAGSGVRIVQPAQVVQTARLSDGSWRISIRHREKLQEVNSRFVVDASGAGNVLRGRRQRTSAPLLALYAQWSGVDNDELAGRVEAGEQEWFWFAPLGCGRSIVAVFLDPKRLSTMRPESLESRYERLLQRFLLRARWNGRIEGAVKACDASSRYAEEPVGPSFVKIGDAAFTLDPLSSQGVQSAIASALQAAIVVNTFAKYPINLDAAMAFYRDRQREKVEQHVRKTASEYRKRAAVCDQPFWIQRSAFLNGAPMTESNEEGELEAICRVRISNRTRIESSPVIQGDTVVPKLAVNHETLGRPVAFVGGVDIVPLLNQIRFGQTAEAIVTTWSRELSVELSWKILQWLWFQRIVVPICSVQQ